MISTLFDDVFVTQRLDSAVNDHAPSRGIQPPACPGLPSAGEEEVFVFPATAAQRRFWLLDQWVPGGNPALNMPLALRLHGELDLRVLTRCFNEILRRHEILRTTFHCEKGQLLQAIAPRQTMTLPLVDVADFPPAERARVPAHLLAEEARRPFDLARGPLLRARVVRLASREHLLLFPTHHIIADGWSNGVFVRELGALYAAFGQGQSSPLPELAVQFADFSQWQVGLGASGGFDRQLDYWRKELAGDLPVLDLPVDRARGAWSGRAAPAGICERRLPGDLVAALKALGGREAASPFMVFLTAFSVLLSRYAGGQEDVVVGTSTANRGRLEVENLIGLFVNPLLLRLDLSGEPTFRELLARVRRTTLAAFEHADAPFEKLVEELQPRRLQVNFLYQQDFVQSARWLDLAVTPEDAGTGGAVYEWNVLVLEDAAGVRLHCEYHAGLFETAAIERLLRDFAGLLTSVAAAGGSDRSVVRLPLGSVVECDALTHVLEAEAWRLPDETVKWMHAHVSPVHAAALTRYEPLAGRRLRVLDAHEQPVPVGVPGELCVVGLADEMLLRTGDIARLRADGSIRWIGPSGAECKVNGLRVDRCGIETALRSHPHVRQAVVRRSDDEHGQPFLTAYCQGDGAPPDLLAPGQLRGFLQEHLPDEWIPAAFVAVDHFPLTRDGRLREAALPAPDTHRPPDPPRSHDAPYLALHHQIIEIWREVLHVRSVGIRDDFFNLGGNSLSAMRMLYRVEQAFGKALLPATLFRRATVEHLAEEILARNDGGAAREIVHVQATGSRTPIFYLHGDISGGGFYCVKLARDLGPDQPFYALPPYELDNPLEDRPTVEQMAAAHLATIRSVRPHGPYVIGGFCLGGLIAGEVARQLVAQGETVERLLVIDANPRDRRLENLRAWVERVARWRGLDANRQLYLFCRWHYWLARWDRFRGLDRRARRAALSRRLHRVLRRPSTAASDVALVSQEDDPTAWFDPRLDVPLVFLWAVGGYRAKAYAGRMTLLLSSDLLGGAGGADPVPAWRRRVAKLEVVALTGTHLACITEHVADLARAIRRCLADDVYGGFQSD